MDRINHISDAMENGATREEAEYSWVLHRHLALLLDLGYTHDEVIEECEAGSAQLYKQQVKDNLHSQFSMSDTVCDELADKMISEDIDVPRKAAHQYELPIEPKYILNSTAHLIAPPTDKDL